MTFAEYIKPELLVLVPVLYVLGAIIKDSKTIQDRFIPAILGAVGVGLSLLYILGSTNISTTAIFTAITQGLLVAGAAVYTNEFITQLRKPDENKTGEVEPAPEPEQKDGGE